MSGHVDAESLALYAEGQLSRRRTARVRAHLSGCAECARTAAALTEVTAELSHVPVPPMPSAVAARLDAALNAEAARRAAGPSAAPAPAGAPEPRPPRPPRRGPLWSPGALRILAATGATLVVAGGVGYALSQVVGSPSSGSAASASSPAAKRVHHSHVAAEPNVSPGSRVMKPHMSPNTPNRTPTRFVQTDTDYHPSTLAAQSRKIVAEYGVGGLAGPSILPADSVSAQVRDCISRTAQGRPVRLVDLAHYQHQPAIVIVLGNPDTVTAVGYSCKPLHSAPLPVTSGPTTR